MTKRLTILLFGLFIPFTFADVTISTAVSNNDSPPVTVTQAPNDNSIKLDITKAIVKPLDPPVIANQVTDKQPLNFALSRSAGGNLEGEEGVNEVLPDLFNSNAQESFGIRGDVIKSVHLKERGDIDGANIKFIFRQ